MLTKLFLTCVIIIVFGVVYIRSFSNTLRLNPFDYIVIPLIIISVVALPILLIIAIWTGVAP